MSEVKKRLDYLDIAKCLTIILVIIGHASANTDDPFYRCAIYYFHMPLFFIVSGVVSKVREVEYNKQYYKDFIIKSIYTLLIPYLIWALIYSKFSWKNVPYILYGSWETLTKAQTLTSLWYLPCLFLARIWMELIIGVSSKYSKFNQDLFILACTAVSFTLGFLLPQPAMGYPLCFNISFVALGFMLIGYMHKELIDHFQSKGILFHLIKLVVVIALFEFSIRIGDKTKLVLMCGSQYGNPLLFLFNALLGVIVIFSLSALITKKWEFSNETPLKNAILWVGRNTIGIFLVHKPFLQEIVVPIFTNMGYSTNSLGVAIICMLIDFPISCLLVYIINKYTPGLFGKYE